MLAVKVTKLAADRPGATLLSLGKGAKKHVEV
jgi:hypothetical protein